MLTYDKRSAIMLTAVRMMLQLVEAKPKIGDSRALRVPDAVMVFRCLPDACTLHEVPYVHEDWNLDTLGAALAYEKSLVTTSVVKVGEEDNS